MLKLLLVIATVYRFGVPFVRSDELSDPKFNTVIGRITEVSNDGVSFDQGCRGKIRKYTWKQIERVKFSNNCLAPKSYEVGGAVACLEKEQTKSIERNPVWFIQYVDPGTEITFATDKFIRYDGKNLTFQIVASAQIKTIVAVAMPLSRRASRTDTALLDTGERELAPLI